ncbi:hypothetical protein WCD74_07905 [Actinomycetospora sp. OC33-EN08]|uniref:Uncharacterized protein n=1 Tax=Actinomycetospora aurantiaca TaxID=3129233 RepID=A0ABU8MMN6_9PSEU
MTCTADPWTLERMNETATNQADTEATEVASVLEALARQGSVANPRRTRR